jgi:hypothetical protein
MQTDVSLDLDLDIPMQRRHNLRYYLPGLLLAGALCATGANLTLDQISPGGGSNFFGIDSLGRNGQSFTPSQNNLAGFGMTVKAAPGTVAPITVQIWDQLWTAPGASLLVQQTSNASTPGAGFTFNDFFWTPISVTPGQRYFARLFATDGVFITGAFIFNPYVGGTGIANNSPSFETGTGAIDLTFHTWYDADYQPGGAPASGVPEPATVVLFGFGIGAVWLHRRRM